MWKILESLCLTHFTTIMRKYKYNVKKLLIDPIKKGK